MRLEYRRCPRLTCSTFVNEVVDFDVRSDRQLYAAVALLHWRNPTECTDILPRHL
jgi:hypothetical protein